MKIGVLGEGWWAQAVRARGDQPILVKVEERTAGAYQADFAARLRCGPDVVSQIAADRPDVVIDNGAAGLVFVEGSGGLSDVKLAHEVAGVPLVSHLIDPVVTVFAQLPWGVAWPCLSSRTWTKAVWDRAQADELIRFGVPGVIHVPMAAMDRPYCTDPLPLKPSGALVSFIGGQNTSYFHPSNTLPASSLLAGVLASAVRGDMDGVSFDSVYHDLYELAEPPSTGDAPATLASKAHAYFVAKLFYNASLCIRQRDRFVIFLSRKLGDSFRLIGSRWDAVYGLPTAPPLASYDDFLQHFRDTAVNVNLVNGNAESGLNMRHFEITAAGGFMLCYRQPELAECFEIGRECDVFSSEQELLEKLQHYLAHPQERQAIAYAGQQRTLCEHLYSHRLETILKHVPSADTSGARESTAPRMAVPPPAGRVQRRPPARARSPRGKLLVIMNPGRFTRHYLHDMATAARRMGIGVVTHEIGETWARVARQDSSRAAEMDEFVRREHVAVAIGSQMNGLTEWPLAAGADGRPATFFESRRIAHLLWWTDHPQWASERVALSPDVQPLLASANQRSFVKSESAAAEIRHLLGWSNVHGLPVAEDPISLPPARGVRPEFDVVAIIGSPPRVEPWFEENLSCDEPDVEAIGRRVASAASAGLRQLWADRAPEAMRPALGELGDAWVEARRCDPLTSSFRHFIVLRRAHADAADWLERHPIVYFDALERLWDFGRWERTFVMAYLARHFRVAVFGSDWSALGIPGGGWVDHHDQPAVYARGRLAINVSQAGDEEGISHKPFQIAASGVPMVHIGRQGLAECFEPDIEVATFATPAEARRVVGELLSDRERASAMGEAARRRLLADHTWETRLPQILQRAGVADRLGLRASPVSTAEC